MKQSYRQKRGPRYQDDKPWESARALCDTKFSNILLYHNVHFKWLTWLVPKAFQGRTLALM